MTDNFKPDIGKGDLGFTDLLGGRRVSKTDRRIKLNALLDELSAILGQAKTTMKSRADRLELGEAQKNIIIACGIIAGMKADLQKATVLLEARIKTASASIKPLKIFALAGSGQTEALLHLARAKTRLCEILAWELKAKAPAVYLNRLSDSLFLAALKSARK